MDRPVPVLAKCKTDKSERHQCGPGYHHPMRILHRLEKRDHFRASALPANVAGLGLSVNFPLSVNVLQSRIDRLASAL
jgi:hypothetical protein